MATDISPPATAGSGDKFYETQNVCDRCYERVYDALKETDMLDDTLFISTADHGGTTGGHAHGNNSRLDNTIVYFGLGGQTVDSGKRLTGGETTDLGTIVLNTLGYEKPASMRPSEDFTRDSANDTYLSQEELAKRTGTWSGFPIPEAAKRPGLPWKTRSRTIR